ncbi:hypothetical protein [Neptunicella marina]|uniref:Uncharacterized protein n=1 Tax=Neptunicella marina TaxID=2125989 RepID=A0A8J6IWS4_9ALTE|nr:hypothetical protein [Neptunicella marina]MBC3767881.1 hypothetical protein [Neptunicella marina]
MKFKSLLAAAILIICGVIMYNRLGDLAYKLGFIEISQQTILQNTDKQQVKCRMFAWGFVDEIRLHNNYQKCISNYEQQGYKTVNIVNHSKVTNTN